MDEIEVALIGIRPTYQFDRPGIFVVTLDVTDAAGNRATDTMTVTVVDIKPPIADAGPDQTVEEGARVIFNGSGSSDTDGIVNYTWIFKDGAPVMIYGDRPDYRFENPGLFVVMLKVMDVTGHVGNDNMIVTVIDTTPPVADAGPDLTVDVGTVVTFDAGGCSDNVGILNYTWTFKDLIPMTLNGINPNYLFEHPGVFIVTLDVIDDAGNRNSDALVVTVIGMTSPVADAGPDRTVDEGTLVMFDGSGSSDNVGIVNYTWTFDYGTQRMILCGVSPSFAFDMPGIYSVRLNVSNAAKLWSMDAMILTVRDITPPVADAGRDQKVAVGTAINLSGASSKDNVGIVGWHWNFSYDGKEWSIAGENITVRFDRAGVYNIVLTVLDGAGNRGEDRINITVVKPPAIVDKTYISGPPFLALLIVLAVLAVGGIYVQLVRRKRSVR